MNEIIETKTEEKKKEFILADDQIEELYRYACRVHKKTIDDLCPALFEIILNSANGRLKNELGRIIFHLQKNERLNTRIGLGKLINASLIIDPERLFTILKSSSEKAKELANNIDSVL